MTSGVEKEALTEVVKSPTKDLRAEYMIPASVMLEKTDAKIRELWRGGIH